MEIRRKMMAMKMMTTIPKLHLLPALAQTTPKSHPMEKMVKTKTKTTTMKMTKTMRMAQMMMMTMTTLVHHQVKRSTRKPNLLHFSGMKTKRILTW